MQIKGSSAVGATSTTCSSVAEILRSSRTAPQPGGGLLPFSMGEPATRSGSSIDLPARPARVVLAHQNRRSVAFTSRWYFGLGGADDYLTQQARRRDRKDASAKNFER